MALETLRLFTTIARCHSFSKAAMVHGITQSAASQRLQQLERRLGVQLLDRRVRPLALTEAGRRYLEGCEELIEQYDRLERDVRGMQDEPTGLVSVAAIYSVGIELLDGIRDAFVQEHSKVTVELRYEQPGEVHRAVQEHTCDLGILSYPEHWDGVEAIALRDEQMSVVCRPGHVLAGRRCVHAAELSPYAMVTFHEDLPVGRRIRHYLREHGGSPRVANALDNIDTIKNTIAVTDRFSILPRRTVRREVEAGSLALVDLEPPLERPVGIIYRRRHHHGVPFSPAAQCFVDFLLKRVRQEDAVGTSSDGRLVGDSL